MHIYIHISTSIESLEAGRIFFNKIFFFGIFMISIGFQFDYELNSKNHSKKIKNVLDFFRLFFDFFWIFFRFVFVFFWIFFWFFSISIGFFLKFDFFSIFFDFFGFFFDFNWISIGFFWISIGFFHERWRSDKPEKKKNKKNRKKNQKPNPKLFFIFLILIGSIPKSNRIEIQKNQNKIKKKRGK